MQSRFKNLVARTLLVSAFLTLLAGCANPVKESVRQSNVAEMQGKSAVAQLEAAQPAEAVPTFSSHDGQWVDPTPVAMTATNTTAQMSCVEHYHPTMPMQLASFGELVGRDCRIPVHISPDASYHVSPQLRNAAVGSSAIPSSPIGGGMSLPGVPGTSIGSSPLGAREHLIDVQYDGALPGLLDQVCAQLGLGWRIDKNEITIFYLETRTFRFAMIPSATKMTTSVISGTSAQMGVSNQGSGGGSGGGVTGTSGTNQETDVTVNNDLRTDFEKTIKEMISAEGRVGPLDAMGSITVTDTPDRIASIQNYVDTQNHILDKQILFRVKVLAVTVTKTDSYGINWNLVYQSLNKNYGFSLANVFTPAQDATSNTVSVLKGAKGKAAQFAGTSAIINALAEQGNVAVVTQADANTLNMQPAIVQVAKQTGFLASEQTSNVAQVGSSTSLQQGNITSGFNMNLIPDVLDDGQSILLQYNMNLSSDPVLRTVSSQGSQIEIPTMDTKILSHKVELRSGQTLILSGFEQNNLNGTSQGVGSPSLWMLGGGLNRNDEHIELVVLITPIVSAS